MPTALAGSLGEGGSFWCPRAQATDSTPLLPCIHENSAWCGMRVNESHRLLWVSHGLVSLGVQGPCPGKSIIGVVQAFAKKSLYAASNLQHLHSSSTPVL